MPPSLSSLFILNPEEERTGRPGVSADQFRRDPLAFKPDPRGGEQSAVALHLQGVAERPPERDERSPAKPQYIVDRHFSSADDNANIY